MIDVATCIKNIRTYAKAKDINIGLLETSAGVSAGYLSRMDKKQNISISTLNRFADVLNISPAMLLSEVKEHEIAADLIRTGDFDNITIEKTDKGYAVYVQKGNGKISAAEYSDIEDTAETMNNIICRKEC